MIVPRVMTDGAGESDREPGAKSHRRNEGSHPAFVGDWTNEGWWVLKADDLTFKAGKF